jgi:hypothetical protein
MLLSFSIAGSGNDIRVNSICKNSEITVEEKKNKRLF